MINLTMQQRGLPIAYALTAGNQAQTSLADLGRAVLDDPRVTALGLHIEGIGELADFEDLARYASACKKGIVALKVGRTAQAQLATISHTASLTGSDASADALLSRLGIARVDGLAEMIETLKILHYHGPLAGKRLVLASCSGGEASLLADTSEIQGKGLIFPPLIKTQKEGLRAVLGDMVALANPLDYHTYIWGNLAGMADAYNALLKAPIDLGVIVVDFPRSDRCDPEAWECVIVAAEIARQKTSKPIALLASLAENMSESQAARIAAAGLIPLSGIEESLGAIAAAASVHSAHHVPVIAAPNVTGASMLDEAASKALLRLYGLDIPQNLVVERQALPDTLPFDYPVVLKAMGQAHKSEMGGVKLGLADRAELKAAMAEMDQPIYLIEEMVEDGLVELLVGVVADPAHGYLLTLAAGGVLTEILKDSVSLSLPIEEADILTALEKLRIAPLLTGYRGKPAADTAELVTAVLAVQDCVLDNRARFSEVELNPLILTPTRAVAVDALIKTGEKSHGQSN